MRTMLDDDDALWAAIEAAGPLARAVAERDRWDDPDDSSERSQAQSARRRTFIAAYAYAVPTRETIEAITHFFAGYRVLEVCAGSGLWARLLTAEGADIVATDGAEPIAAPHFPIVVLEATDAVNANPECKAMLICWPSHKQDAAYRALRSFGGDHFVFVGDPRFTADDGFHALLATEWDLRHQLPLPSWPGLADAVHLYVRRTP